MKLIKKFLITTVAAMPVFLCSCPGESCVDEHEPKGYVVKMKNDYSDNVLASMFIYKEDTNYCCTTVKGHTIKITEDFYKFNCRSFDIAAYTSIKSEEWDKSLSDSLSKYVIDTDPFEEVYAYYKIDYSNEDLKRIINNKEFNKFKREK
ncbi:MAG: hypothetical protein K6F48_05495 [Paludibacteraceae bacterium]|nr:hypothetical protein [Paludibacteraceae bacterium]